MTDIGLHAVRNSKGEIFTDNRHNQVNVFDPGGKFLRTIGRPGGGPGEFGAGAMRLAVDDADRLYVRHGNRQWSVFSRAGDFLHATAAGQHAFDWETTCITGKGILVTSAEQTPDGRAQTYNLAMRAGAVTAAPRTMTGEAQRAVACASGERYWIGGTAQSDGGAYTLELRTVTGQKIKTLTRSAPWFRNSSSTAGDAAFKVVPSVAMLTADSTGLLLSVVIVPNSSISKVTAGLNRAARDSARDAAVDVYLDVIDERAGKLLATAGPLRMSEVKRNWFGGLIPGTLSGYRREETAETASALRLVDLKLYQR